jgi:Peptidase family U32
MVSTVTTQRFLQSLGLPGNDNYGTTISRKQFADGGQYRIEIPSCEGPSVFREVVATAKELEVPIHRVSQGSGIMLLLKTEIQEMVRIGRDQGIEVCLFVGPRAQWDVGAQVVSRSGSVVGCQSRGTDQLIFAIEDVRRACDLGIRSILAADLGLIWILAEMKRKSELPGNLIIKSSVELPAANPATAKVLERLGVSTLNLVTDLSAAQIGAIREAINIPIDFYVEVPDAFGGFLRYYEIPQLLQVAAPIYFKFGIRNAPSLYPTGAHLDSVATQLGRERVRRARIGLDILKAYLPEAKMSPVRSSDLGIPEA